jgi:hypothetical protein
MKIDTTFQAKGQIEMSEVKSFINRSYAEVQRVKVLDNNLNVKEVHYEDDDVTQGTWYAELNNGKLFEIIDSNLINTLRKI